MKRLLAVMALLILTACQVDEMDYAVKHSTCTPEQMVKVQDETLWCKANSDIRPFACYATAIMRNCKLVTR